MRVYFSGISGTGIGPLAELAKDAGYTVMGSDLMRGAIADEIDARGIDTFYGQQDGAFLRKKYNEKPIDWFVYTSALPQDHPELTLAKELGIKISKRDEFLANFVKEQNLKMIAIAGTHGKTTTTAIMIWTMRKLGLPISFAVGTTLGWAPGAYYSNDAKYFIYEADEYDRNFLAYHPYMAVLTEVDYDHPDIYPTREDYLAAFSQFESQSENVVKNTTIDERITLVGELRRKDASAVLAVVKQLCDVDEQTIIDIINEFPGAGRRFERIFDGVYSDYGHHPAEIKATVEMAAELKERDNYKGLAIIYQPHQNVRQHEVFNDYHDAFIGADKLFWLPTYLTREDPNLEILTPEFLIEKLDNKEIAVAAKPDTELAEKIRQLQADGWLILLMTAGPADTWLRNIFGVQLVDRFFFFIFVE